MVPSKLWREFQICRSGKRGGEGGKLVRERDDDDDDVRVEGERRED